MVDCIGKGYATLVAQIAVDRKCFASDALQRVRYLSVHYPKMWSLDEAFHTVRIFQVRDGFGMCTYYRSMVDRLHLMLDRHHFAGYYCGNYMAVEVVVVVEAEQIGSVTVDPYKCFDKMLHLFRQELKLFVKIIFLPSFDATIFELTVRWSGFLHFLTHLTAIVTKSFNLFCKTL